ncbi:MAG TPA: leucyl aminopeptidase [Anaerohalosphaeraceae bacterium]|nr:leucyl aminopeptidase [Anaerohalosphaeraceae bacterium]
MKKAIDTAVVCRQAYPLQIRTDVLAVGVFEKGPLGGWALRVDRRLKGQISRLLELKDFKGKLQTTALLYTRGQLGAERVLLVGLGEKKKAEADTLRKAAAAAASAAVDLRVSSLAAAVDWSEWANHTPQELAQAFAEGIHFGAYRYLEYRSPEPSEPPVSSLQAVLAEPDERRLRPLQQGIRIGGILGKAQNYARTIANRPANVMTPAALAAEAQKLARRTAGLRCTVLDEKKLAAEKMGGILAVGKGSANPPRLIVLRYSPSAASSKAAPMALIGKAITFDSGGVSLKPSEGLHDMKFDKSGGAAVLAAMAAVAALKPRRVIYGIIPAAENLPSGTSYRPGDIVTTYSGKTVEIQNTDAEGRMLLCDAIAYAVKLGCNPIVDTATLTGACVVALGTKRAGLMGNDAGLLEAIEKASRKTGERVWRLPCDDEYVEAMKSQIADLKNVGGKWGGACTAAAFLSQFVGKARWAHLDIAGVGVWGAGEKDTPGSIGFGVRLLTTFAMNSVF